MILILESEISLNQKDKIKNMLSDEGCIIREINDAGRNVIGIIGKTGISLEDFKKMDGIVDAVPLPPPINLSAGSLNQKIQR